MVTRSLQSILAVVACLISAVTAINPQLVGTWSTKSAKVLTGPVCFPESCDGVRQWESGNCSNY
jgi:hypothetical protein